MSEWFHVGQQVQCIGTNFGTVVGPVDDLPVVGQTYTVHNIVTVRKGDLIAGTQSPFNACILVLVEMGIRIGYDSKFFRPLRKRTTSIEVFRHLLVTPPKEPVDA